MAYCLRNLPPHAQSLIDEMGQHRRDLEQLKAVGGTPTARIMKGFEISSENGVLCVAPRDPRNYWRKYNFDIKDPCRQCWLNLATGAVPACGSCRFRPTHMKISYSGFFFTQRGIDFRRSH